MKEHVFPLDHGEDGLIQCEVCHINSYVEYTCYGCHEHQPGDIEKDHKDENIALAELQDCVVCHLSGKIEEHD